MAAMDFFAPAQKLSSVKSRRSTINRLFPQKERSKPVFTRDVLSEDLNENVDVGSNM